MPDEFLTAEIHAKQIILMTRAAKLDMEWRAVAEELASYDAGELAWALASVCAELVEVSHAR